jgi:hypothetical protein
VSPRFNAELPQSLAFVGRPGLTVYATPNKSTLTESYHNPTADQTLMHSRFSGGVLDGRHGSISIAQTGLPPPARLIAGALKWVSSKEQIEMIVGTVMFHADSKAPVSIERRPFSDRFLWLTFSPG